jgi:DNA polymerase
MVIIMARAAGLDLGTMWTMELAAKTVAAYRKARRPIVQGWYKLDRIIATAWVGKSGPVKFGPCLISKGRIELPNGLALNYADPKWDAERQEFTYRYGRRIHHIYGAKMLENIVQTLARIVVMNAALRIYDKGYRFILQGHDELVFILPKDGVDKAKEIIHKEMVRCPSWAPTVPLKADIGAGLSYGDAK